MLNLPSKFKMRNRNIKNLLKRSEIQGKTSSSEQSSSIESSILKKLNK